MLFVNKKKITLNNMYKVQVKEQENNAQNRVKYPNRRSIATFDRALQIIGIAFDIKDLFQELGILPDKQSDEFEKVLSAIGDNYVAIQEVGNKVDRNFAAMQMVYTVISQTLSTIEETRREMRQEFKKVFDGLEDLKVGDKIANLATFIDDFTNQVAIVNSLSPEIRVTELNRSGGILDRLNNAVDSDGILHNNLNQIFSQNLAIPKDENDIVALAALHIMYYGVQTYVSIMFFILDQYSFLADYYYYKQGDIEKCNGYFDLLIINFKFFKDKLLSSKNKKQVINKVIDILDEVESLLFIRNNRNDIFKLLAKRVNSLHFVALKLQKIILPIDLDRPEKIRNRPNFSKSKIDIPLEAWTNGTKISYAIQCKRNNTYSKIGEWSDPVFVSTKACPLLKIPVDSQRRTRLIYRKFNDNKPELVGAIADSFQTDFRDINRDVFNAAMNSNEETGKLEIEILLKNGANLYELYENSRRALHAAAQSGNTQVADFLLLKNNTMNVNVRDDEGFSPIYIASEAGYDDFVKFLLNKEANVNIKTNLKQLAPLHIVAYNGYTSTIKTLLNHKNININIKDNTNFTPLHSAVYGGINVVNVLMSYNSTDINAKSKDGLTPLHLAAINDYSDVAKTLINNKNIKPNCEAKGNMTALHFASSLGNLKTVQVLVESNNTNLNIQSFDNLTALHFAISLKKFDIAQVLLNLSPIDVNIKAKGDITALHLSALLDHNNITLKLIERKTLIEDRTKDNLTALHIAVIHDNFQIVSTLIDHGANKESKCNGSTPVHLAAFYGSKNSTTVLLNKGANIKEYDENGLYPVHIAAKRGQIDILRELLDFNASLVNLKSLDISKRSSSLHFAAEKGYLDVIKYLIEDKNADFEITNKYNDRPLHCASRYAHIDVVKYLVEKKNCHIEIKNGYGETPIHLASLSGSLDIVKYLIDIKNASIDVLTATFNSPLHYATLSGNLNMVKYLLNEKHIDINGYDYYNRYYYYHSPLTHALWYNRQEVYTYLIQKGAGTRKTLEAATLSGNLDLVKYIANLTLVSNYPVNIAAAYGYLDIVKYYIDEKHAKLDPNMANVTQLHFAALSGNLELVKYFVEDKNIPADSMRTLLVLTPLCFAALSGNLQTIKYFVEKGARTTPLYDITAAPAKFAVASGNLEVVKYFVEELKINFMKGYSLSSHKLVTSKDLGLYNSLTKYTELTDLKNFMSWRSLHPNKLLDTAISRGYLNIIRYFVDEQKVPTEIENTLFTAVGYNMLDVVRYLVEDKKVNVNMKDNKGQTPLYEVFRFCDNYIDIVKYLVDEGKADINNKNNYGSTVLHEACRCNAVEIPKYFLMIKNMKLTQEIILIEPRYTMLLNMSLMTLLIILLAKVLM